MRIRKQRAAFLLLLIALPLLLADDAVSLMLNGDDEDENDIDIDIDNHNLDLRTQQQEQDSDQAPDDLASLASTEIENASSVLHHEKEFDQLEEHQQAEPIRRPQHENDILAESHEYENQRFDEEERIAKDYSSAMATTDSDVIGNDKDNNNDIYTDNSDNDGAVDSEQDLGHDIEESASQTVHEDGFRLPTLSKTEIAVDFFSSSEVNDEVLPQPDDASKIKSQIIENINDDISKEEKSEPIEISDRADNADFRHETSYKLGHSHIETIDIERESIVEELVVDKGLLGSFGSIGTTNTDEAEVEDEEVVVIKDAKLAIGTTSIEFIEGDDNDDGRNVGIVETDDLVIDGELPVEKGIATDGSSASETIESYIENKTEENFGDKADQNTTTDPVEAVDNVSISSDTEVEGGMDADISAVEEVGDEDGRKSSDDDAEGVEIGDANDTEVEVNQIKDNDDDDNYDDEDEDLTERVSVDYASKSAGALIIEKTAEFKGTSNLITGDRDKYAIVPCSEEKKHVVLSLSEDILVKEIKLANYERFSSTVKDFQVKGSHTLGKWVDLGTFSAESGNGEQTFVLENPTWARYLKFRFLTHHGVEWYCTLSQIKVHGSNMVQGFHEQWESIEEENNEEQLKEEHQPDNSNIPNTDASENIGGISDTKDLGDEVGTDGTLSNSSVASRDDNPDNSTESDNFGATEKIDSSPRHAQVTPSVHSRPKPLQKFRTPSDFSEIIEEEMADEKLFTDLYNLIPHTMGNLPAHMKNDIKGKTEESELRSVHQIGMLAMESLYSIGSRIVDDLAFMVTDDAESRTISSPKMNGFSNEYYQKKFGSDLLDKLVDQSSTETEPSQNKTSVGSTRRSEESSTHQTNGTHEDIRGQVAVTGDNTSVLPSQKEESSTTVANVSAEEAANHSADLAIFKLLKDLPSAECLVNLDFAEFKKKISATRKSTGTTGGSHGNRMMEPIFTKLTDEIFALQTSLSVHDQFAKMSVGCYQRVILDLALETEKLRRDQDERLRRLEEQILEPANLRMFYKLVASLVSYTVTFLASNGSLLFLSVKNVWIPTILRYLLSKDTYEGFYNALKAIQDSWSQVSNVFQIILNHSSGAINALTTTLESKEWAKRETYEGFLSAWSTYYDGGMVVVATVLTLIFCRMLMWCSSFRRRKSNGLSSRRQTMGHSRNVAPSSRTSQTVYPEEQPHTTSTSKKHKRKSRKSKHRTRDRTIVPIVEDISAKASEESIPELEDEPLHESSIVSASNRNGNRTSNSPSVVSLEEE